MKKKVMENSAYVFVIFIIINPVNCVPSTKLPELLLIDDSSREILFLDLYKRVSALEARTQMSDAVDWTQQTQFDALKNLAENQQEWLNNLDKMLNSNRKCEASKPAKKKAAFSASLDHDINTGNSDEDIVFNRIILNEGSYYNPATGVFNCPWNGVYDISFFIGQRTDDKSPKGVWASLKVNGRTIAMGVVDVYNQQQDLQGGNRVLVRLEEGDKVVVVATAGGHIEGSTHRASTFSAVYLFD